MRIVIVAPDVGRYPRTELVRRLEWEANSYSDDAELAVQAEQNA